MKFKYLMYYLGLRPLTASVIMEVYDAAQKRLAKRNFDKVVLGLSENGKHSFYSTKMGVIGRRYFEGMLISASIPYTVEKDDSYFTYHVTIYNAV